MTTEFFRFPRTPHLFWLGKGTPRDDKVLSSVEVNSLLAGEVVVEEKLDGANLGISIGAKGELRFQNRGQYLTPPYTGQFEKLTAWTLARKDNLAAVLGEDLILFGEWCAARHSVAYDRLPDWFLVFDVYDRSLKRFWSTSRRDVLVHQIGLTIVPMLFKGRITQAGLKRIVQSEISRFHSGPLEGVVVRRESTDWLEMRAKLVHADFTQAIGEHWRRRKIEWNRLAYSQGGEYKR